MKKINIAMDGPSGAGKSSIADQLAEHFNLVHLDTGGMYRSLTYYLNSLGIEPEESSELKEALERLQLESSEGRFYVNGVEVTDKIRTPEISSLTSLYSSLESVREKLVHIQQEIASQKGFILDGRDICEYVLPDAEIKIYLDASDTERARRRWKEQKQAGSDESYEEVLQKIQKRDYRDTHRKIAPLIRSKDAFYIDSSHLSFDETVQELKNYVLSVLEGEI